VQIFVYQSTEVARFGQVFLHLAIPILMYHQIDVPPVSGTPLRGLIVSPAGFARQMKILSFLGYRGLSLSDLMPYLRGEKKGKVVGLTFDDGYLNNLTNAMPVMLREGFTATCYAVSAMLGGQNDWDAGKGVARKKLMSAQDWREWLKSGMEAGSHTRHHVDLTTLDPTGASQEIAGAKQELEDVFGVSVQHFCYPFGRYSERDRDLVQDAGYVTATTTHRGRVQTGTDRLLLPRAMVAQATQPWQFILKIATAYEDRRR
jgi:peptidoglycan/xylan/chitin deacetylase (PgdA/CDA1 family)